MAELVDLTRGRYPRRREKKKHELLPECEEQLTKLGIKNWPPIFVKNNVVLDGMQRVLLAKKLGVRYLPGIIAFSRTVVTQLPNGKVTVTHETCS